MLRSTPIILMVSLLAGIFSVFAQGGNEQPRLPDQYAEAVLQVEGML